MTAASGTFLFLDSLLQTSPNGTAVYETVRSESGVIANFRLTSFNELAAVHFHSPADSILHQLVSELFPPADSDYLIRQFALVVDSGRAVRFEMPFGYDSAEPLNTHELLVSRFDADWVVVSYGNLIDNQPQQQAELLDRIIQTAPSGLALHRTLFDEAGNIVDFQIIKANQLAFDWLHIKAADAYANPLSVLMPEFQLSEVFHHYVHVAQTGEPARFERSFGRNWYEFSVARFDKSIIVTVNHVTERKKAELTLKEHYKIIEGILDAIPVGVFVSEAMRDAEETIVDYRVTKANATALLTTKWKRSDVIGQRASVVFAGDRYDSLFNAYTTTVRTQETQRFEHSYQRGGQVYWLDVQLAYIGRDRVLAAYNDVTPLKVAETQRRKQAETFTGVLKSMRNGMNVLEIIRDEAGNLADFQYEYVSDQVLLDTNLSQEQLIGYRMLDLFPAIKHTPFWEAFEKLLATGEPQEFETSYLYQGYHNHLLCQITQLDESRVISSYQIINELKEAQFAFQKQSELLRSVIDNVQVGIGLMTAVRDESNRIIDLRWVMTNEGNARITKLPVETMLGARMSDLLPGVAESDFLGVCIDVINTGIPFQYEFHYTLDNVNGWFDVRIVKQDDGILFSSSDITKRKQAELDQERQNQILKRANRDLELSNENLQQFAYVASHDLQEPLRKIQAFGDLVTEQFGPVLGPDGSDMLNRMQVAAKRMSLLIRDLLTYSRVGTQLEAHKLVSLNQIVSEAMDALYVAIQESGAEITVSPLPSILGDPLQLSQLFQNLLGNAIKFCRPNTIPSVQVTYKTLNFDQIPPQLIPKLNGSGPFAEIAISDKGIGFDAQYAERIFQVFQRLHGRNHYAGSGIGLSICRRVAENHGGTITATSQPGQGATFRVYLPA